MWNVQEKGVALESQESSWGGHAPHMTLYEMDTLHSWKKLAGKTLPIPPTEASFSVWAPLRVLVSLLQRKSHPAPSSLKQRAVFDILPSETYFASP